MSGGGGGGGDWRPDPRPPTAKPKNGGGSGGPTPGDPCNITETTALNSPDRNVIATLRQGQLLTIAFQPGPPQLLVAQTAAGAVAGSITSTSMLQLIQCIQNGNEYVAEVISIRGAICQVRVRPK